MCSKLASIDSGLIHSLHDGRTSTEHDKEVKHGGLMPFIRHLVSQNFFIFFGQLVNVLKGVVLVLDLCY